ncbi:MAG: phosphoribosylformylglycinamidine cyclo-ligase [Candidatus Riflebacteria bacterium]|nr:phosphoribosylformylglycinamidine cyclo-ligase [Candidatus Riflebacteria bacterium]
MTQMKSKSTDPGNNQTHSPIPNSSGIDLDSGHSCSKTAFAWAKKTFSNRAGLFGSSALEIDGAFCNIMKYGDSYIGMTSDGIGTKVEIAERVGDYSTLGYDLTAMVTDDLIANGVEPANLTNILDVDSLDHSIVEELMKGLYEAANFAGISVTGGEIAELGSRIGGWGKCMHFNWCATAIGFVPPGRKPITGATAISPGDHIIALKSRGFRSNGFSMIRKILSGKFGEDWHLNNFAESKSWGRVLLTPSLIYSPGILKLFGKRIDVNGIAHITGGGIPDNLGRILKYKGLGAYLDNVFEPHDFMIELQRLGKIEDEQAYRLWNMGNGMLLIVSPQSASKALEALIESGYTARVCGSILSEPGVKIRSCGAFPRELFYAKSGK